MTATKTSMNVESALPPRRVRTEVATHKKLLLTKVNNKDTPKKALPSAAVMAKLRDKYLNIGPIERHHTVMEGVPVNDVLVVLNLFHLPRKDILEGLGISERTLQRNEGGKLSPAHSGAALALLEVTDLATRVFGRSEDAEHWLSQKSLALDGERPLDLLTSAPGIDAVKDLLTRIEYGVYA